MASVFKRKESSVWWAQYYIIDAVTKRLKMIRKSTGHTSKKAAMVAAMELERSAQGVMKAGSDKAQRAKDELFHFSTVARLLNQKGVKIGLDWNGNYALFAFGLAGHEGDQALVRLEEDHAAFSRLGSLSMATRRASAELYKSRHVVENVFCKAKWWDRITTRRERRGDHALAWPTLFATITWIN